MRDDTTIGGAGVISHGRYPMSEENEAIVTRFLDEPWNRNDSGSCDASCYFWYSRP